MFWGVSVNVLDSAFGGKIHLTFRNISTSSSILLLTIGGMRREKVSPRDLMPMNRFSTMSIRPTPFRRPMVFAAVRMPTASVTVFDWPFSVYWSLLGMPLVNSTVKSSSSSGASFGSAVNFHMSAGGVVYRTPESASPLEQERQNLETRLKSRLRGEISPRVVLRWDLQGYRLHKSSERGSRPWTRVLIWLT